MLSSPSQNNLLSATNSGNGAGGGNGANKRYNPQQQLQQHFLMLERNDSTASFYNGAVTNNGGVVQNQDNNQSPSVVNGFSTGPSETTSNMSSTIALQSQSNLKRQLASLMSFLFYIQDSAIAKRGLKEYITALVVHLYIMWVAIFMPTLGEVNGYTFGSWGSWVFSVLNWPLTFSMERLPYVGSLGLAFASVAMIWTFALIIVVYAYLFKITSKYLVVMKTIFNAFCKVNMIIALPMLFVMMNTTFDCNTDTMTLNSFPLEKIACYNQNDTIQSTIFMVLFVITFVLLFMTSIFCFLVVTNNHPLNFTPFLSDTPLILIVLQAFNLAQLFIHMVIPTPYMYAKSGFHLVCAIAVFVIFFKTIPFLKRIDNSFFALIVGARIGSSFGVLISNIVSVTALKRGVMSENDINSIGIGLAAGVVVLAIMCGLIFFTGMELYTRYSTKVIRNQLSAFITNDGEKAQGEKTLGDQEDDGADESKTREQYTNLLEKSAFYFYQNIEEMNLKKQLKMFIKFSFLSSEYVYSGDRSVSVPDLDTTIAFIKGISTQSSFSDIYLLVLFASIISNSDDSTNSNAHTFANSLLKKAKRRKPNIFLKFFIKTKSKEIAKNESASNSYELVNSIENLELQQDVLRSLHIDVWKELMNENINYNTLEAIMLRIGNVSSECDTVYENLMYNYSSDPRLVKSYAKFLELFMFNKEEASELYSDAMKLESEEKKGSRQNKPSRFSNKITPHSSSMKMSATRDYADNTSDLGSCTVREVFDGVENRNDSFAQNLQMPHQHTLRYSLLGSFILFSLIFLGVTLGISIYFSSAVTKEVMLVLASCAPITANSQVILEIRSFQTTRHLYNNSSLNWPESMKQFGYTSFGDYRTKHKQALKEHLKIYTDIKKMANSGGFSIPLYSEFHERYFPIKKPQQGKYGSNIQSFNTTKEILTTISDITNMAITFTTEILELPDASYNSTIENYAFMWIYENNETITNAYNTFCNQYMDHSIENGVLLQNTFLGVYFGLFLSYSIVSLFFISFIHRDLKFTTLQFKLFEKTISKNVIGKIYHTLSSINKTRTSQLAVKTEYSKLFNPQFLVLVLSGCLFVFTVVCAGLLLQEMMGNGLYSRQTYVTMKDSNDAGYYLQRLVFSMSELYAHNAFPSTSFNTPPLRNSTQLEALYNQVEDVVGIVRYFWNLCAYGSSIKADETLVIGMYPDIDKIIRGDDNCTLQDIKRFGSNCTLGLDKEVAQMADITVSLSQMIGHSGSALVHDQFVKSMVYLRDVSNRLILFSGSFSIYAAIPSSTLALIIGIISFPMVILLAGFILKILLNYSDAVTALRMMVNYIPAESIETSEDLKNYILFHSVTDSSQKGQFNKIKRAFTNKVAPNNNDSSVIHSILNASIDGVVMCMNSRGDVDVFNPVAQSMFGYSMTDVVGRSIFDLFDESIFTKLKQSVESMIVKSRSSNSLGASGTAGGGDSSQMANNGETFETECIRKNKTKFPCKISIFIVLHNNKEMIVCYISDLTSEKKRTALLKEEKKHSEELLLNILPHAIATKLKHGGADTFIVEKLNDVSIFFSDMVGFTAMSSNMNPNELIALLNEIVMGFDDLTEKYNIEKIKTIGDAYFCVGGLHDAQTDHPERLCKFACETFGVLRKYNASRIMLVQEQQNNGNTSIENIPQINIRIGINTGGAVAGVIGRKKFAYDLWGDTINVASRMESTSVSGRIQISRSTYERVHDQGYVFEERLVMVKGKGECQTYLIDGKHHVSPIIESEKDDYIESSLIEKAKD